MEEENKRLWQENAEIRDELELIKKEQNEVRQRLYMIEEIRPSSRCILDLTMANI